MSVAHRSREELQRKGEYVVRANVDWFALFPQTLEKRKQAGGDRAINLVLYRTKSGDPRDHYVIPIENLSHILTDDALADTHTGGQRWNIAIVGDTIRVTHTGATLDIAPYRSARLLIEAEISEFAQIAEEIDTEAIFQEGSVSRILVNRYERDKGAREACIAHFGAACQACDITFSDSYGEIAADYIHVHHLRLISEVGASYIIDPIEDLRPLCPNCHAVAHMRTPPFGIAEIRAMLKNQTKKPNKAQMATPRKLSD